MSSREFRIYVIQSGTETINLFIIIVPKHKIREMINSEMFFCFIFPPWFFYYIKEVINLIIINKEVNFYYFYQKNIQAPESPKLLG